MPLTGDGYSFLTAALWAGVAALYARAAEQRLSTTPFVAVKVTTAATELLPSHGTE